MQFLNIRTIQSRHNRAVVLLNNFYVVIRTMVIELYMHSFLLKKNLAKNLCNDAMQWNPHNLAKQWLGFPGRELKEQRPETQAFGSIVAGR